MPEKRTTRQRLASGACGAHVLLVPTVVLAMALILTFAPVRAKRGGSSRRATSEAQPRDGQGAYATRKYRNLFAETGHSQKEIDAKIAKAYKQLFHGDKETERLFFPSGQNENGPLAYIPDIQHTDVRSEGMSYGMMIAVQLDRKAEFDALWNWSMTYMYQGNPRHPSYGFFSWEMASTARSWTSCPRPTARSTTRWRSTSPRTAGEAAGASTTTRRARTGCCTTWCTASRSPEWCASAALCASTRWARR